MAKNYGVPPQMILNELRRVISASKRIVAHNIKFDVGVLKKLCHVMKEPMPVLPEQYCTMQESKDVCKIPTANGSGYKWPKLAEAYFYFAKKQLNGAHDALVDVYGCRTVYRGLQKLKEE
jgi:DNA polymerase III epsilon subunit-like protein